MGGGLPCRAMETVPAPGRYASRWADVPRVGHNPAMPAPLDPAVAEAAMRAVGLEPLEPYPGARRPWRCIHLACGLEVTPRYGDVRAGQGGCIHCRGAKVGAARRGDPDAAAAQMRDAGFEPLEDYRGANHPWPCRCTACGRESSPRLDGVLRGRGCRYCAGITVDPVEAVELAVSLKLIPLEPYPGNRTPWPCHCLECGRTIDVLYRVLRRGKTGCQYCAPGGRGRRVDPEEAARELEAAGLKPLEPYPGADARWTFRCTRCGHEGTTTRTSVRNGSGCIACGRERTVAARRISEEDAVAVMRAGGAEPLEPYPGSRRPWRSRCVKCDLEIAPLLNNVQQGQNACRFCAWGSMSGRPAILYLIVTAEHDVVKVGIARSDSDRIGRWQRRGWVLVRSWDVNDGDIARDVEGRVLSHWRDDLDAPIALDEHEVDGLAGWTETAPLWAVDLDATVALVEQLLRAHA